MNKKNTYSFWRYPWQKYALAIGAIIISVIFIKELKSFQDNSLMKDQMYPSWEEYQNRKFYSFVFYSVILFNIVGQFLIAKIGRTEKRSFFLLFIIMLVSTLAIGIAGFLFIAHSSQQMLQITWLLLLALLSVAAISAGIKITRFPSDLK